MSETLTADQWRWFEVHRPLIRNVAESVITRRCYQLSAYEKERLHDIATDAGIRCARSYTPGHKPGTLLGLAVARDVNREIDRMLRRVRATAVPVESGVEDDVLPSYGDEDIDRYAQAKLDGWTDIEFGARYGYTKQEVRALKDRLKEVLLDSRDG